MLIFTNSIVDSIHASNFSLIPIIDFYHQSLEFIFPVTIPNIFF